MRPRSLIILAVLLMGPRAFANEPEGDSVAAQVFFQKGRSAASRGDSEAACRYFKESLRLDLAVGTLFNIAQCEEELGRLASAWQHLTEGIERLDESDPRRGPADASARELSRRVPRLEVRLSGPSARVFRDGVELSATSLGVPLPVEAGTHVVVARAPGHIDASYTVTLTEFERRVVDVQMGALEPAKSLQSSPSKLRNLGWASLGLGAAGAFVGGVFGGLAWGRNGVVEERCNGRFCDETGASAAKDGRTFATLSTGFFVGASVFVLAGVALVIVSPRSTTLRF